MKRMFKKYKSLNNETMKKIYRTFKNPSDKATFVMINSYCSQNNIEFHINIPRMKYKKPKIPELLSGDEVKLMIKAAPHPYDLAIRCIFNMGAGLRISEIIKFSWDHIRWVDWLGDKDSYGVAIIKEGKGGKERVVNIPKNLMVDLYKYAADQGVLNEFSIPSGSFLFEFGGLEDVNTKNNKYLKRNIATKPSNYWKYVYVKTKYNWFRYNVLQKYCEKALNKKLHIHQLRHSRATYLYEVEKQSLADIQKLLGHASLDTTMRYIQIDVRGIFESMKNTMEL